MQMRSVLKLSATAFLAACYLAGTPASAQERPTGPPTACVSIKQVQVAFIASGALGGGALAYQGKSYPITVGGIGIGGFGASRLRASGAVYGLERRTDFAGAYVQLRSGWALGDQGRGTLWLRNEKGVVMRLKSHRQGLQLTLGADGVLIGFK